MDKFLKVLVAAVVVSFSLNAYAVEDAPMEIKGATTIDTKQAEVMFDDETVIFIDPRKQADFDRGHIPGSVHLDLNGKSTVMSEATLLEAAGSKDRKIVFYCNGPKCLRSAEACTAAAGWGFSNLFYYRDGFPAWQDAGLPVE